MLPSVVPPPAHFFRLLVESVADYAICVLTPAGLIASWNVGGQRTIGYAASEIIGRPFDLMFGPGDRAAGRALRDMDEALARGPIEEQAQLSRKDGSLFWALYTVAPLREDGQHVGFAVVVRDITERKRQEELARTSEARLRTALRAGRMGAWAWDVNANRSFWNDREYELLDLSPGDGPVDTDQFFERVHPDDLGPLKATLRDAIERGTEFRMDFRILRRNGDIRWLTGAGQVTRDATGGATEMYGVNFDITEQKIADEALRSSEERFRAFMDHTPAQVWIDDEDGVNRFANAALARELGRPAADIIGRRLVDLLPAGAPVAAYLEDNRQVFASGTHSPTVVSAPRHDGTMGRFLVHKFPITSATDRTRLLGGVAIDVTERERALEALRASEERFRLLVECVKDVGIFTLDINGVIETWNAAAERLYGYTGAEIVGRHRSVLFTAEDVARGVPQRELDVAAASGKVSEEGWRVRKDGSVFWANGTMSPLYDDAGRPRGFVKVVRDLTERRRAQEALEETQQRLELAAKSAHIGIWDWNLATDELVWDDRMYELYGVSKDGFTGAYDAWRRGVHPDDRARSEAALAAALQGDEGFHAEFRVVWPNGEVRDIEAHGQARRVGGSVTHVVGVNWDITARKKAESALRLRDRAIQAVSQGILITDPTLPDNPIVYASRGFEGITGYTSLSVLGQNCRFLQGKDTDPDAVRAMREAIEAGREFSVEILNYKLDGSPFWNALFITPVRDDDGRLMHFVGVQADVTERKSLERAFQQSQKMESIGRLAGGVGHDFNNLLTIISGYSELLMTELAATDPHRELVAEIQRAGERAAGLTQQLLAFSRKQVIAPVVLDLNDLLAQTHKMLSRLLGEDIVITTVLSPSLPRVKIDPAQIDQVVMNLCVNARDAMPTGGRLTIETSEFVLEPGAHAAYPDLAPGLYAQISVTDTGHGMTEAVMAQIFEPFFTTKEPGKGTGLGLATVFGIVKQNQGRISVYSEVGIGTTFKILFPADHSPTTPAAEGRAPHPLLGTETILLVDDEPGIRKIARISLEAQGYHVLEAGSGAEAIRLADGYAGPIHLLITDVVMPALSGRQLSNTLRLRYPTLRILFMSGYTDDTVIRHGIIEHTGHFIQKPFAPLGLAKKVRAVLDEP